MTDDEAPEAEQQPAPPPADYRAMLDRYEATQDWIGPAELPLVFHLRRLCEELDRPGTVSAALASAYLQAFSRLDKRRPNQRSTADDAEDWLAGQGSIFDELSE